MYAGDRMVMGRCTYVLLRYEGDIKKIKKRPIKLKVLNRCRWRMSQRRKSLVYIGEISRGLLINTALKETKARYLCRYASNELEKEVPCNESGF